MLAQATTGNTRINSFSPLAIAAIFLVTSTTIAMKPPSKSATESGINQNSNINMKCIVYGGKNSPLKNDTKKAPSAGRRGQVLVKVHAVGLNPVDAKDVMGDKLPHSWTGTRNRLKSYLEDKIVGFDFAGTVEEDHGGFQKGEKVFGNMPPLHGTLAEFISVPLDQISTMPKNYSFSKAAAMPLVGLTALQALSPYVGQGSSVLVLGASGGTGHVSLQVARNLGATHITAVCSGRNSDFVKSCGATHFVDYQLDHGNPATLHGNLQKSPGWPFQVVMDCVTSADPSDRALDYPSLVRKYHSQPDAPDGAKSSLVSQDHKYLRLGGQSPDWIRAGMEKFGLSCWPDNHEKLFWIRFPKSSDELKQLRQWAEEGKLEVQIAESVPFEAKAVQGAFDKILERRVQGKIVVDVIPEGSSSNEQTK